MNWAVGYAPPSDEFVSIDDKNWKPALRWKGQHSSCIIRSQFSPDGRYLATASGDHSICVYCLESTRLIGRAWGHAKGINDLCWDNSARRIWSASSDSAVKCFDIGCLPLTENPSNRPRQLPKSRKNGGCVSTFENTHEGACMAIACPKYTSQFFITGGYDECVKKWDTRSGRPAPAVRHTGTIHTAATHTGTIHTGATHTGIASSPILHLRAHEGPVTSLELSADDRAVVSSSLDGNARIWDTTRFEILRTMVGFDGTPCVHAVFSLNNQHLACVTTPHSKQSFALTRATRNNEVPNSSTIHQQRATTTSATTAPHTTVTSNCRVWDTYDPHAYKTLVLPPSPELTPPGELGGKRCILGQGDSNFTNRKLLDSQRPGSLVFATCWRDKVCIPWDDPKRPDAAGVHVWDIGTGVHVSTLQEPGAVLGSVTSVSAHPDVNTGLLATTRSRPDNSVVVWMYDRD